MRDRRPDLQKRHRAPAVGPLAPTFPMFGFLQSNERKMRENADNWLHLADKIAHYRRDQLSDTQTLDLRQKVANLRQQLKQRADASKLKLGIESLEGVLRQL